MRLNWLKMVEFNFVLLYCVRLQLGLEACEEESH